jgi:hypothetical protein
MQPRAVEAQFLTEFRKLNPSWAGFTAGTISTGS